MKWIYRLKEEYGGKKLYKTRLVVKGFAKKKGTDFDEIFSHVEERRNTTLAEFVLNVSSHRVGLIIRRKFFVAKIVQEISLLISVEVF